VTLDVIARSGAFSRVECFSMELVAGLDVFREPVLRAAERHGVKVHFVPHWDTARLMKFAILRPHVQGAEKLTLLRLKDIELALTKRTGIDWFSYGERASDSLVRRLYTSPCDGVQTEWRRLWPIWDWKLGELRRYMRLRQIRVPKKLGVRVSSGVSLQPHTLFELKKEHPNDYRKILEVFPFAEAQVFRVERGDFNALPGVKAKARKASKGRKAIRARSDEEPSKEA